METEIRLKTEYVIRDSILEAEKGARKETTTTIVIFPILLTEGLHNIQTHSRGTKPTLITNPDKCHSSFRSLLFNVVRNVYVLQCRAKKKKLNASSQSRPCVIFPFK
jgi:hypothetical protein